MPDPEFYAQCIEDSFNELRDAALSGAAPPESAAKTKAKAKKPKG
jgi:hypothetical protein